MSMNFPPRLTLIFLVLLLNLQCVLNLVLYTIAKVYFLLSIQVQFQALMWLMKRKVLLPSTRKMVRFSLRASQRTR
jgi:hypothetical protein